MQNKRPYCQQCQRPLRTCLCDLVKLVPTETEVVILQHPSEAGHAKGSARLLHLCLPNSRLYVGEVFQPDELQLQASGSVLLYPGADNSRGADRCEVVSQLLVLDGTWRKSRKLLYLNPWLQDLPRLALDSGQSRYRIRKPEFGHQLSTFEATLSGLSQLEGPDKFTSLGDVFTTFVDRYERFINANKC
ncbi:tRNA-uridine aminocarboxypropyltransferase [Teredinibacter haidensis]|uniref:tRNA-uridine aminocarboxypropyltransferase n=1 Tax=Teredinibacter haidensis TaxID=2731755 RepID=UPI000948A936|nr:tRNA-uridine aminocarboxypropyltransferase [Teredinibacter haidensis]